MNAYLQSLSGRRALVCGSTQGIGRACAIEFAERGAQVTLLARDLEALRRVQSELAGTERKHDIVVADFRNPEHLQEEVERHIARTGGYQILLNNTGGPPGGPIYEAQPSAFVDAIRMHLVCNQILVQAAVPGMKEANYGRVLNIISTSVREPIANLGVSNATRAAVAGWAKTLSQELGPFGITVNNILPGFTQTRRLRALIEANAKRKGATEAEVEAEMKASVPLGRFASSEEVGGAAGFLASPAASYITGVSLPVDGGRLAGI